MRKGVYSGLTASAAPPPFPPSSGTYEMICAMNHGFQRSALRQDVSEVNEGLKLPPWSVEEDNLKNAKGEKASAWI